MKSEKGGKDMKSSLQGSKRLGKFLFYAGNIVIGLR